MAKDLREIKGSVRGDDGTVFISGMEDELSAVLKPAQIKRLTEEGVISGFEVKAEKAESGAKKSVNEITNADPSPTPTAEQIVTVSDITMLSVAEVREMIAADEQDIADAKWARTLTDISLWSDIENEAGDIKKVGSIEFFEGANITSRLSLRNRIRARYGKESLTSETSTATSGAGCAITSLRWF